MTDEMRRSLNEDSIHETNKQSARNESNGTNNHSSKSRPGSPTTDSENEGGNAPLDTEETEIAANFAAINSYNGPLRKSNPDIPEAIAEEE